MNHQMAVKQLHAGNLDPLKKKCYHRTLKIELNYQLLIMNLTLT